LHLAAEKYRDENLQSLKHIIYISLKTILRHYSQELSALILPIYQQSANLCRNGMHWRGKYI